MRRHVWRMKQAEAFLTGAGDAWHKRNKGKPLIPDPVLDAIEACKIRPKSVLELGCGTGWRLAEIDRLYKPLHLVGHEPSAEAVQNRLVPNVFKSDALSAVSYIKKDFYDLVIFGFCLYLVDREDLMMIGAHTDRILKDGGHIVIHDFLDGGVEAYRVAYKHKEGIWSYHMHYPMLWLSNPAYASAK